MSENLAYREELRKERIGGEIIAIVKDGAH